MATADKITEPDLNSLEAVSGQVGEVESLVVEWQLKALKAAAS